MNYWASGYLTFQIESPSEVEIYINDLLVERRHLSPGEYTFSNLPHATGSGKIAVVIKDAYGRTKRFEKDFYTSSSLLKPGIQEYSYNLGYKREGFGQENFEYEEGSTFLAFHQHENFRFILNTHMAKESLIQNY